MAKFSFNGNPLMTDEMFNEAMTNDYGITEIAKGYVYCDKNGNEKGKYANYPSYTDVHDVTNEQVKKAKECLKRRKLQELASIDNGVLAFVAMGMEYESKMKNGIGCHRICCYFRNSKGRLFYLEFSQTNRCLYLKDGFWLQSGYTNQETFCVDFSIDKDLQKETGDDQKGYYAMGVDHLSYVRATWNDVLAFVNKTYGCNYKSGKLIRNFLLTRDEFVCVC